MQSGKILEIGPIDAILRKYHAMSHAEAAVAGK
jgi:hypothetical protein